LKKDEEYIVKNRAAWNAAVPFHVRSAFYAQENFLNGASTLKPIELDLIGDVVGKEILHLQCHFGQDTISLQRLGAIATGVDFSEAAIEEAKSIARRLQLPVDFVCSDIYHLPMVLPRTYDVVFTTYGVLGWLPDMNSWASVVSRMLKPGGKLILVEFHPFVWTMDGECSKIAYDYFNNGPIIEIQKGSYADRQRPCRGTTACPRSSRPY
jgi:2-polyprenyl-3-methyl-5-hydroxy-6-metoxy-1,4-benzoquinol methylase